jgi:hypothetical protein
LLEKPRLQSAGRKEGVTLLTETVFVMELSPIKFGFGARDEIGFDASRLGIADPGDIVKTQGEAVDVKRIAEELMKG